ncbi:MULTISPECIES: CoA transferase [Paraburkholderia]|uniref:CoA transferase n=1 Tax=Paraburkholderia madseniana TaxID=2599607 RepID=A0AAP5BHR8_9BURK|nr:MULTISPECIES: CoA transferase [Paraburkholderia]MCX4149978.1 CoA transferase [Paraburkholderia madseniana]MDN7152914.1 CoA transferase [Paraburkholderia sp. WS6]MDQ6411796.1 CoA transferase [Paraburkholderia madseniana]
MSALPLKGVRVIELCWVWSGPLLGQLLADLGAEVIKVEWYKRFDLYRTRGVERLAGKYPEQVRREMSHSFHGLNRNKIGVTLDLKLEHHRDALIDLVRQSDMVIENFTAGTLERLGIGFDVLAAANPAIVLLSLAGFGSTSRLAEMRAYGLVLSSMSGLETKVVDPRNNEFLGSPTFVASDPNAATFGLLASVSAVLDARRTGVGAHVEISQLEAAASVGNDDDKELTDLADSLGLSGSELAEPASIVATGDGQHLCVDWRGRIFADDFARVSAAAADSSADSAIAAFEGEGARAVRVIERPAEFGAGAAHEDTLLPTLHPVTGAESIVAAPWWIDGSRSPLRKTAPTLGEGNAYVLGKLLNWPPEEYGSLEQRAKEANNAQA